VSATMTDLLYPCPKCKTIYEIARHHVRPAVEPLCEVCQEALPVADGDDWLTYRRVSPKFR
jgi:hypothetical protein